MEITLANTIVSGIMIPNPAIISISERKIPNPYEIFFGTIPKFWIVSARIANLFSKYKRCKGFLIILSDRFYTPY